MFCSQCGKQCTGKFCWNCGAALTAGISAGTEIDAARTPQEPVTGNWQASVNYEEVMKAPRVRDVLAKIAPPGAPMSAEGFVETFGKIVPTAVPLVPVMKLAQDVYSRLGIKTGKTVVERLPRPVGQVIACAVCAIAKGGYKLLEARQASDGCTLLCEIPSDMFSFAGQLLVTIQSESDGTSVHAATSIKGQLYDWGKSKRVLAKFVDGVAQFSRELA